MNKKKGLFWILLVIVLVIGLAYFLYNSLSKNMAPNQLAPNPGTTSQQESSSAEDSSQDGQTVVEKAPDFTMFDADGNEVKLSDFFGKPIVLNFWSSRCGPCKMEMPDFNEAHKELGDSVQFLMVNMTDGSWDTLETAQAFIEKEGYEFPVYFDTEQSAASTYGIHSLPTTFFIDENGVIAAYANSAINQEVLQKGLDMILPNS